jgi:hypothetical protein
MHRNQNKPLNKVSANKSLPAQIVSPAKAFGVLCLVDVEEAKSFAATEIPETEVVNEIKRFENTTHLVAKEIESAAKALKKDNYR